MRWLGGFFCALVGLGLALASAQTRPAMRYLAADTIDLARDAGSGIDAMLRTGELEVAAVEPDAFVAGRTHERLQQVHRGVPVFGANLVRQLDAGLTVSAYGVLAAAVEIETTPTLAPERAAAIARTLSGGEIMPRDRPRLVVVPTDQGGYALAYRVRTLALPDVTVYFIDAHSGAVVLQYSDLKTQAPAVGRSRGVLNDVKKISVEARGGTFRAVDRLRPIGSPSNVVFNGITTFDVAGEPNRIVLIASGRLGGEPFIATDADNDWTEPSVADAHPYSGLIVDYLFKRFGRRGLDDDYIELWNFVNPVRLEAFSPTLPSSLLQFYCNASYIGSGNMIYGLGLPDPFRLSGGRRCVRLAGGFDVVAHELAHGVTEYTSDLIYQNESGALNESFSDIFAESAERFFQPAGNGSQQADWLIGEDVITGGLRSMADPLAFGDPDHYSRRFTGTADGGGVHTNSSIPNHAFYLAIQGGQNRTSGLAVQGVGIANHEQVERAFYRAFTQMLPQSATFALARAATVQAARDLYGAGSAPERAIAAAWTAVGVQ
jgi:Zn-dependent metalloprotease